MSAHHPLSKSRMAEIFKYISTVVAGAPMCDRAGRKKYAVGAIRRSNRQFEEEVLPGPICGLSMNLSPRRCRPKRQSQDVSRPAGLSEPSCDNSPPLPIPQPSPLERRRGGQESGWR